MSQVHYRQTTNTCYSLIPTLHSSTYLVALKINCNGQLDALDINRIRPIGETVGHSSYDAPTPDISSAKTKTTHFQSVPSQASKHKSAHFENWHPLYDHWNFIMIFYTSYSNTLYYACHVELPFMIFCGIIKIKPFVRVYIIYWWLFIHGKKHKSTVNTLYRCSYFFLHRQTTIIGTRKQSNPAATHPTIIPARTPAAN